MSVLHRTVPFPLERELRSAGSNVWNKRANIDNDSWQSYHHLDMYCCILKLKRRRISTKASLAPTIPDTSPDCSEVFESRDVNAGLGEAAQTELLTAIQYVPHSDHQGSKCGTWSSKGSTQTSRQEWIRSLRQMGTVFIFSQSATVNKDRLRTTY